MMKSILSFLNRMLGFVLGTVFILRFILYFASPFLAQVLCECIWDDDVCEFCAWAFPALLIPLMAGIIVPVGKRVLSLIMLLCCIGLTTISAFASTNGFDMKYFSFCASGASGYAIFCLSFSVCDSFKRKLNGPYITAKLKRPSGVRPEGAVVAGSSAAVGVEARLLSEEERLERRRRLDRVVWEAMVKSSR